MGSEAKRPVLVNVKELAETLQVSRDVVYRLTRQGAPCFRTSRGARSEFRFDVSEVLAFLRVGTVAGATGEHPAAGPNPFAARRFVGRKGK